MTPALQLTYSSLALACASCNRGLGRGQPDILANWLPSRPLILIALLLFLPQELYARPTDSSSLGVLFRFRNVLRADVELAVEVKEESAAV